MDMQEMINYLDELIFSHSGKHLDNLQVAILQGVLNGQKYAQIAENYNCTAGHAKDKAYELWSLLGDVLDIEELNKSNFRATIQRLGIANFKSPIVGNRVKVRNINLCGNGEQIADQETDNDKTSVNLENTDIEIIQRVAKLKTVPKLAKLGLTCEQIAQALDLSLAEVKQTINLNNSITGF